jgi:hypothetical protein
LSFPTFSFDEDRPLIDSYVGAVKQYFKELARA